MGTKAYCGLASVTSTEKYAGISSDLFQMSTWPQIGADQISTRHIQSLNQKISMLIMTIPFIYISCSYFSLTFL